MKIVLPHLLIVATVLAGNTVRAENADWKQVREADKPGEVDVFVRPVDDSPIKMFRGVIQVPQPMLSVMALMGDIERYPDWVFQCSDAEIKPDQWGPDVIRIKINGIWPVSDRDIAARSTMKQNPDTNAITIHSQAVHDVVPEQEGWLRIPELDNRFRLESLDNGRTRITFRTFVDPGGHIPAWLANFVATRAPEYTLTHMAEFLKQDRYQLDSVDELPTEFPGVKQMTFPSLEKMRAEKPESDTPESGSNLKASPPSSGFQGVDDARPLQQSRGKAQQTITVVV